MESDSLIELRLKNTEAMVFRFRLGIVDGSEPGCTIPNDADMGAIQMAALALQELALALFDEVDKSTYGADH